MWLLTLLFAIGIEALFTFIRTYVDERGIGSVGTFFLAYGGVAIVVRIACSSSLDGLQQFPMVLGSMMVFAAGMVGLGLGSTLAGFVAAAVVMGAGHGFLFPVLMAQVVTRARDAERGSAMAIFTSLFDLAVLTAAPAVGIIIDRQGYDVAFVGTGALIGFGLAVYAVWERAVSAQVSESAN